MKENVFITHKNRQWSINNIVIIIDLWILTARQPIKSYFIPRSVRITFILRSYLHFLYVILSQKVFCTLSNWIEILLGDNSRGSYGSQTWPIKWNAVSFKQSCRFCYIDVLHGCWWNGWRKSLTATTQECCEQFWTSPGGNNPQSSSCTDTYLSSRELSKLDEPNVQDTVGEAGTSSKVMFSYGPSHMVTSSGM